MQHGQCKPSPTMLTQTIFYLLALAIDFGNNMGKVMHNGHVGVHVRSARIFGYQHVGIGEARISRLGSILMQKGLRSAGKYGQIPRDGLTSEIYFFKN